MDPEPDRFQVDFHRRWRHLHDPHVRSLAWLLDAPGLLDPGAPRWGGKIATLDLAPLALAQWLAQLDAAPTPLHAYLNLPTVSRLGRYAEKLMAYYFTTHGTLVAHGLQVQAARNDTVGEFDFLLRDATDLIHWELATKFYLFEAPGKVEGGDYFIGPNLADTLDTKMEKILQRQLALSLHPAAQAYLPQPVLHAKALIKGWLFYHRDDGSALASSGVAATHCRGFWGTLNEFEQFQDASFTVLPRLSWLAPARVPFDTCMDRQQMGQWLSEHFSKDPMPVMLALIRAEQECFDGGERMGWETARGFIVPDDWRARAGERMQRAALQPARL